MLPHYIWSSLLSPESLSFFFFFCLFYSPDILWKTRLISCILEEIKGLKNHTKLASNHNNVVPGLSDPAAPRKATGSLASSSSRLFSGTVLQLEWGAWVTLSDAHGLKRNWSLGFQVTPSFFAGWPGLPSLCQEALAWIPIALPNSLSLSAITKRIIQLYSVVARLRDLAESQWLQRESLPPHHHLLWALYSGQSALAQANPSPAIFSFWNPTYASRTGLLSISELYSEALLAAPAAQSLLLWIPLPSFLCVPHLLPAVCVRILLWQNHDCLGGRVCGLNFVSMAPHIVFLCIMCAQKLKSEAILQPIEDCATTFPSTRHYQESCLKTTSCVL